jgi:hypothetical protein
VHLHKMSNAVFSVDTLLGLEEESSSTQDLLIALIPGYHRCVPPEVKAYSALKSRPSCTYHNYKDAGVSLCFEGGRVTAVHVYNGAEDFAIFTGPLPHEIR